MKSMKHGVYYVDKIYTIYIERERERERERVKFNRNNLRLASMQMSLW